MRNKPELASEEQRGHLFVPTLVNVLFLHKHARI